MKRILSRYLPGSILAVAFFGSVNAQSLKSQSEPIATSSFKDITFKEAPAKSSSKASLPAGSINTKALKSFNKSFKETTDVSWFEAADGGYVAKFQKDDILTRVQYNRKGLYLSTIRSYKENNLPKEVRHLVKSTYYDYNIFWVDEVTIDNKTAYLVKVEDEKSFMTIRVIDGEMDVYESFKKG